MAKRESSLVGGGVYVFGIERIGHCALHRPVAATSLVLLLTVLSAINIAFYLKFDGDISHVLASRTEAHRQFAALEVGFRRFSYDEVVFIRSPNLRTVSGFEALRNLHLDLQLVDDVGLVVSVFSFARKDQGAKGWRSSHPGVIKDDASLAQHIKRLLEDQPAARSMFDSENGAALLLLMPRAHKAFDARGFSQTAIEEIAEVLKSYKTDGIETHLVGKPAIEREIVEALKSDQLVLGALAILVCALTALAIFRTIAAAVVCTLPSVFALAWYLGFLSAIGASIDLLTTVVPVLIIVLAFADTLHLFIHWRRRCDRGAEQLKAIELAISDAGPACALAAVTTAIAFLALSVAANDALDAMALTGIAGVLMVFLIVVVTTPLAIFWLLKLGPLNAQTDRRVLRWASRMGEIVLVQHQGLTITAAILMAVMLLIAHFAMPTQFRLLDYAPRHSSARAAGVETDKTFGGAAQIFAVIARDRAGARITAVERQTLLQTENILKDVFRTRNVVSIASTIAVGGSGTGAIDLSDIPKSAEPFLTRFVSSDRKRLLVTIFVSNDLAAEQIRRLVAQARERLNAAFPQLSVEITGGPVYRAAVVPNLIFDLRHGLMLSVLISVVVIGLAVRSWRLGLACLLPNLLPILAVEAAVWWIRGGIDIATAAALTIGFGLAVDDSVHLLNHYLLEKQETSSNRSAMRGALRACSPVLVATTIVLGVGMSVAVVSAFVTVLTFAAIVISILVFALLADILVLPSVAVKIDRTGRKS